MHEILAMFIVGTASFTTASTLVFPRQDPTPFALVPPPVPSTSSFNWWPYPPGGVASSTPIATLALATSISVPASMLSSAVTSSSTDSTSPTATPTSSDSLVRVTALTSLPASASPSSGPPGPYRPHPRPFDKLWLIPLCTIIGAVLGCAVGWAIGRIWEQRMRTIVGHAFNDKEVEEMTTKKDLEPDVERGAASPALGLGTVRMPSQASTSGARTWVAKAQARKRSGVVSRLPSASRVRGWGRVPEDEEDIAASPLLGAPAPSGSEQEQVQEQDGEAAVVPTSTRTSPYPYGDEDEGDEDVLREPVRHKSIRQRILERLGITAAPSATDVPAHHTWNGREIERSAKIGRAASLWKRTMSQKKNAERVERWAMDVDVDMAEDKEDEPMKLGAERVPLQCAESHLELRPLTGVSQAGDSPSNYEHISWTTQAQATQQGSSRTINEDLRRVSLQDPGPVAGSALVSKSGNKNMTNRRLQDRLALRKNGIIKSSLSREDQSATSTLSMASGASRYGPTSRTPAPMTSTAKLARAQRPSSGLPDGPPLIMSPPLHSELAFEDTPSISQTSMSGSSAPGTRAHVQSSLQGRTRGDTDSTSALSSRGYQGALRKPSPSLHALSQNERYLARQVANARVDMILSRSYSSRDLVEGPSSPNMFGAVMDEQVQLSRPDSLVPSDGEHIAAGIEQRLDMLKKHA